jgi:hypothetical protein
LSFNKTLFFICSGILCFFSIKVFPQKVEIEESISSSLVPEQSRKFISENFKGNFNVKWIKETGLSKFSYEAKFKYLKHFFSVEFDSAGNLQDIEIEIPAKSIPQKTWSQIVKSLDAKFTKWKVLKVQLQLLAPLSNWEELLPEKKVVNFDKITSVSYFYEIVIKTRINREPVVFEVTFNSEGEFIKEFQFYLPNTVNIEY